MLRKYRRIIASCLLIFFLTEILAPTASYALTAGPTAPEATSFEPVDTTDMVNLASGDLAYNIPLLEVPGPSGGYPLSLSYHAGIQPNEEASWVGLGWTLNPGAITRNVNGFADDFKSVENATRLFWEGGESRTYSVGVTIGISGVAGVSASLAYSQDTYLGSGVGGSLGVGANIGGKDSPFGFNASIGISPYGDPYASAGVSMRVTPKQGEDGLSGSVGVGVSTNFESVNVSANAGVDYGVKKNKKSTNYDVMGISIGTRNGGVSSSVSMAGASFISNSRSGVVSSSSSGFNVTIPLPGVSISLGYQHTRYWIDQTDFVDINGTLYFNQGAVDKAWLDKNAYDTYSLPDPTEEGGVAKNPDPEKVLGGTFPGYDNYYVHAQGIGGYMRPYYFQKHLVSRNNYEVKEDDGDEYNYYNTISYQTGYDARKAEFRFIGDFSNRFEYTPEDIRHYPDAGHDPATNPLTFDFSWGDDPVIGESGNDAYTSNRLAGGRHIEYLTNSEIVNSMPKVGTTGFVETHSTGFDRATLDPNGIGAFVITNETGVKYHFALPAMVADEYTYSENISETLTFNEFKNPHPYAYTWFLTAVTGPDYVDRGPSGTGDGILNEYDWGYWVEFEYGKWTEQYFWRNPAEGFNTDLDKNFKNFSEGRKELYYLDAIRTKTHTAFFVKDIRHDAKSTIYSYRNTSGRFFGRRNKEEITEVTKKGGFIPKGISNACIRNIELDFDQTLVLNEGYIYYYSRPTSTLKLEKVFLVENSDVSGLQLSKSDGEEYDQSYSYDWQVEQGGTLPGQCTDCQACDFSSIVFNHHLYQNVLDIYDVENTDLENRALRVVDFNTDYSLCPKTSNSFDFSLVDVDFPSQMDANYPRFGKLTLKSLQFRGKAGASLIPAMEFGYDYKNSGKGHFSLLNINDGQYYFEQANSGLVVGDIIVWGSEEKYYGLVWDITISNRHYIRLLTENTPPEEEYIAWHKTKNPPYDKDFYDQWGMYKPDFDKSQLGDNDAATRLVSQISARNIDVWSLRQVQTSLGAELLIEYESDVYRKPVLTRNQILRVASIEATFGGKHDITIYDDVSDLDKTLEVGSNLEFTLLMGDLYDQFIFKKFDERIEHGELTVLGITRNEDGKWVITTSLPTQYFETRPPGDGKLYLLPPAFLAGNLSPIQDFENYGGGIRVKEIGIVNLGHAQYTSYDYNIPGEDRSSGVTSYGPGGLDQAVFHFPHEGDPLYAYFEDTEDLEDARESYQAELNENFFDVLAIAREIPPPGVIYEYVTVRGRNESQQGSVEVPNYSTYHFQVFDRGMVGIVYSDVDARPYSGELIEDYGLIAHDTLKVRNITLKNFSSRVGSLISVTLFDRSGNPISETKNQFLHDNVSPDAIPSGQDDASIENELEANIDLYEPELAQRFSNQGVIEETFAEARFVRQDYETEVDIGALPIPLPAFNLLGVVTKREEYPAIQVGQSTTNYKSGITTVTENLAFDFYSGQVTRTRVRDGYGNTFITEITPAYRKYPAMGLSASGGKNMLTQEAASAVYKVDNQDVPVSFVAASAQTWSDGVAVAGVGTQSGIWRKKASYSFIGDDNVSLQADGLYAFSVFEAFNFDNPGLNSAKWQKNGEITLYDVQSHALEAIDINGNYAATKMSLDQTRVMATVANASYGEFTFASVEDESENGVGGGVVTQGSVTTSAAHTGKKAIEAGAGVKALLYSFNPRNRTYHVSVWASNDAVALKYRVSSGPAETAVSEVKGSAENWYLIEADIEVTNDLSTIEIWCESTSGAVIFDDFRVHPLDAAMTGYVYNEWGELTHILDNNNLYTEFGYDGMGRLVSTYSESLQYGRAITQEIEYHYANQD